MPVLPLIDLKADLPRRVEADGVALVLSAPATTSPPSASTVPNLGAPMSEGWVHRGQLVCPWHGSRFRLDDGKPASGPATAPLASYDVCVHDGWVEVRRAPRVGTATPGSTVSAGDTP